MDVKSEISVFSWSCFLLTCPALLPPLIISVFNFSKIAERVPTGREHKAELLEIVYPPSKSKNK